MKFTLKSIHEKSNCGKKQNYLQVIPATRKYVIFYFIRTKLYVLVQSVNLSYKMHNSSFMSILTHLNLVAPNLCSFRSRD